MGEAKPACGPGAPCVPLASESSKAIKAEGGLGVFPAPIPRDLESPQTPQTPLHPSAPDTDCI